jgi:hypothetical protein
MDAAAPAKKPVVFNPWLPYWAVFQADVAQTLRGWVYRVWVGLVLAATAGFVLYRVGLAHEVGLVEHASLLFCHLLQGTLLGSVAFVVALSAGSIASERGALADSVLSRGISRRQYFLGKWHARLATVLGAFFVLSALALAGGLLLHEDVTLDGGLIALAALGALLAFVVSAGVAVSAVANNSLLGVALLWAALYGGGFALSWLPASPVLTPDRVLARLPYTLCGHYDAPALGALIGWCAAASGVAGLVGMVCFARRDV